MTSTAMTSTADPTKIWAHSGDSHFLEPNDLWKANLPPSLAPRALRTVKDADGSHETIHLDGMSFRRQMPTGAQKEFQEASSRAPGSADVALRLIDLDQEGVLAELVFPSLGMWASSFRDPKLLHECMKVSNDWSWATIYLASGGRCIPTAQVSMLDIADAVAEIERCAAIGFRAVFMPTMPPAALPDYNRDAWEPFWAACERANIVVAFHIGTDPIDMESDAPGVVYRGPGGAVLNYTETTFSGQRAIMKLVASGALDRHPELKVLVSEGGATWVPFLGDRMNEGYRQHAMRVRPLLSVLPKEMLYRQVYASFQHDESAVAAHTAMGYPNVMWGSDYPHMEGTFGHTQKTLHELFDGVDAKAVQRITRGSFLDLFPEAAKFEAGR
jgi:predicted TIM-barrel fold metal-dependent hydrolase